MESIAVSQNSTKGVSSTVAKTRPKNVSQQENPISRKGETAKLVTATFAGGAVLAAKLMWDVVVDGDFGVDILADKADYLVEKNKKHLSANKKSWYKFGTFMALVAAGIAGFAFLYTLFNSPKIAYNGKINTFTKSKEMDVYVKANNAEKEIYTQLAQKAKDATPQEKNALKSQYAKMAIAKNKVPEFVKDKRIFSVNENV